MALAGVQVLVEIAPAGEPHFVGQAGLHEELEIAVDRGQAQPRHLRLRGLPHFLRRQGPARGFDGLAALVQLQLLADPFSGQLFVFRGRRGDRIKVLWWDGDGMCLFAKRLERGHFVWPQAQAGKVALSHAQLSMLLEGIDWRRPVRTAPRLAV